jgi:AP endonuclease-2
VAIVVLRSRRNPFSYEPWRGNRTFEVDLPKVLHSLNERLIIEQSMFDILEADIVVFQETKIQRKDLRDDMVLVPGWDCYFSLPKTKKGALSKVSGMLFSFDIFQDTLEL